MALQSVRNQLDNPAEEPAAKKTKTNDMAAAPALASRKDFEALFPKLVEEVVEHVDGYNIPSDARDWLRTNLIHNTAGGKLNRGLSVLDTATTLLSRPLSPSEYTHLATLGWLTELLQAFFLVADDIMDASHTRRGQPCWYKMPSVGMIAINDSFILEASIYTLLKKHFRSHPAYVDFLELFHEVTLQTEIGQLCDLLTAPEDVVDLSQFSMAKQRFIVIYKTAYYSFYLPVALALHYLQLATPGNLEKARGILIPLGEYFQCQDDYLDVYADPETLGKVGTDVMDNKCSWVINAALERANEQQRKVLDECYGRKDKGKEAECKRVFLELDIPAVYAKYEEDAVWLIRERIAKVDTKEGLKPEVFEAFLKKIYKRSK